MLPVGEAEETGEKGLFSNWTEAAHAELFDGEVYTEEG